MNSIHNRIPTSNNDGERHRNLIYVNNKHEKKQPTNKHESKKTNPNFLTKNKCTKDTASKSTTNNTETAKIIHDVSTPADRHQNHKETDSTKDQKNEESPYLVKTILETDAFSQHNPAGIQNMSNPHYTKPKQEPPNANHNGNNQESTLKDHKNRNTSKTNNTHSNTRISDEPPTRNELNEPDQHKKTASAADPNPHVSCANLTNKPLKSEKVGQEKNPTTRAINTAKTAQIEPADRSTRTTDKNHNMPPPIQSKLPRTQQKKTLIRTGDRHARPADIRLTAATNEHLTQCDTKRTGSANPN
ncbi:sigma 54-interacting transcriptional regulator [Papillibacter cinnamivorans]|uniref:Sigma-54 interaction domain-containing protein n=1 Tax=Papillibacter cinnamivorans DSM 12816 TaxID=1122930 RepID=A0A1W2BJX2_9FIRM|nr:sigma 54-interacting transcriptional regulator [Papillibacter cinnamivorans]SMC72818.1 Sigma-54 interaction domain-containing protein [Papillibacter cinnamivorans DSM 12816]